MNLVPSLVINFLMGAFCSRLSLQFEIAALRHQLSLYQRVQRRPAMASSDRLLWSILARLWRGWRRALFFVRPRTVILWRRKRLRDHWRGPSRGDCRGHPAISLELRCLIRRLWQANPTWDSPHIVAELQNLGIDIAKSTVEKYRPELHKPTSPSWCTFLKQHLRDTVAMHPTAEWTARQLVEACPWESPPKSLLRDGDGIYGNRFRKRRRSLGMKERPIAPGSPWQNPYIERVIGCIRRECLDHAVVLDERHLKPLLRGYFAYYHQWRPHRSLEMSSPDGRSVHSPELGEIIEFPAVHGLHHCHLRKAA